MLSRRLFLSTSLAGSATLAWPFIATAQERATITLPRAVAALVGEGKTALNRARKASFEQDARAFLFQRSKAAPQYKAVHRQLLKLTERKGGLNFAIKAGRAAFGPAFDARTYGQMFQSRSLAQGFRHAGSLFGARDMTFARAVLPGLVLALGGLGLSGAQISTGLQKISNGKVSVDFSATKIGGAQSRFALSRSTGGKLRIEVQQISAAAGADHLDGAQPAPSQTNQGFWDWLSGIASSIADFYLDMIWNMFMGAAAGAGLGAAFGAGPPGAAIGAAAGAGAGAWYTIGKRITGGFWLGPDPASAPDYCMGPPIGLC